jgi:hypothetical protein
MVFFVAFHVLDGPFDPSLERVMPDGAIVLDTDCAGNGKATVRVYKQLNGIAEFFDHEGPQFVNLFMGFMHIEIPGHCQMAVDMKCTAVFDNPDIVNINPVLASIIIEGFDHSPEQILITLIHNPGHGGAHNAEARKKNHQAEDDCHRAVQPWVSGDI